MDINFQKLCELFNIEKSVFYPYLNNCSNSHLSCIEKDLTLDYRLCCAEAAFKFYPLINKFLQLKN